MGNIFRLGDRVAPRIGRCRRGGGWGTAAGPEPEDSAIPGSKERKGGDGKRKNTKRQNAAQDVAARKDGDEAARPKTKGGVPRAKKAGHQTK